MSSSWNECMSIEIVKHQVKLFVSSSTPEVMGIKGAWGVGKTYSWKKYLSEYKLDDVIALPRYSYVSLFGINSLESFKYAIFENTVKRDLIGTEASLETFKENATGIADSLTRKYYKIIKNAPLIKNFSSTIESLSFLSITETLICIDDLERKGEGLDIKDLLGLISLLKEQKKCKIVILLNDGEDGLDDYFKYREKVIDLELEFSPTAHECAVVAFEGNSYEAENLRVFSEILEIKNIRVLKKIERLVLIATPFLQGLEIEVTHQVIHSLVLFSWAYYCSKGNDKIPSFNFVTSTSYSSYGIGGKKNEEEKTKNWKVLLHKYGYGITDELDLVLAKAVETGYIVEGELREKSEIKNSQILASKSENSFTKAWELYHHNFDNNQDEVVEALYESLVANAKHISPMNLNGTVTLFRELGEDKKASDAIDKYIESRKSTPNLLNLNDFMSNPFSGDVTDPEIKEKFEDKFKEYIIDESANSVLARVSRQNSWNDKDITTLGNTTVNEFYKIFKKTKGIDLSLYVESCLKLGNYASKNGEPSSLLTNSVSALKMIAAESDINKRRVKKFGIDIDIKG
jgi:hypothetical protein